MGVKIRIFYELAHPLLAYLIPTFVTPTNIFVCLLYIYVLLFGTCDPLDNKVACSRYLVRKHFPLALMGHTTVNGMEYFVDYGAHGEFPLPRPYNLIVTHSI